MMNLPMYQRVMAGEALTHCLSSRALWRLNGPDAARYLNGQVTNDIMLLNEGRGCYAAVCTAKGRMEGDVFISLHAGGYFIDADASLRESLGARLEKYLIADDAVLEEVNTVWSLSHVFGVTPPAHPESGFIIPHERFGRPGHDLWIASSGALVIGDSVGSDVVETIRLEHGIPRWGSELTPTTLPPEAGPFMTDAISYTKGCYVGQETIARLKSVGHVNRTLVFLRADTTVFPPLESKILMGDQEVGTITSSGLSPQLGQGVALGYVQLKAAAEGTALRVDDLNLTVSVPVHK